MRGWNMFTKFCLIVTLVGSAFGSSYGQSVDSWREDLNFLRDTVVRDYPNLFHDVARTDWEQAVAELDRRLPELQRHEIIIELSKLVAMFRIGHTYLQLGNWRGPDAPAKFHTIPIFPYWYSDGLYVQSAAREYERWVGARIVQIGQVSANEALEKIRPAVVYENEMGFRNAISFYLNCPEVLHACGVINDLAQVPITFEIDGRETEVNFKPQPAQPLPGMDGIQFPGTDWVDACRLPASERPLWLRNLDRKRDVEYLPEQKLLYVRHSVVLDEPDETIADFFKRVLASDDAGKADKFVLDLRLNGGGNNYLNNPVITGLIRSKFNERGRFFVITGRRTFSACQNLVNELEKYTEAVFVGEPTGERINFWGDNREVKLPNSGLSVRLSWLWWQNSDPRDTRMWKAPEVFVELSHTDFRDGVDPALNAVLDWTPREPVEPEMARLLQDEGPAAVLAYAQKLSADPKNRYAYERAEVQLNDMACDVLQADDLPKALALFKLIVELFPDSPSARISYADALSKSGDKPGAIESLRRAIALDPRGPLGHKAAAALEQLGER